MRALLTIVLIAFVATGCVGGRSNLNGINRVADNVFHVPPGAADVATPANKAPAVEVRAGVAFVFVHTQDATVAAEKAVTPSIAASAATGPNATSGPAEAAATAPLPDGDTAAPVEPVVTAPDAAQAAAPEATPAPAESPEREPTE